MDVEKIWEEASWVEHSRNIIENIDKFPEESKIVMVLRHSHRNDPKPLENVNKLRLTPQGHAVAKKFGENLPISRSIKISHSIVWRCEETAENIHNAFLSIGGDSELKGIFEPLFNIGLERRSFAENFKNRHFREILFRWVSGFYLPEDWTPFTQYCQNTAHLIWSQVKKSPHKGINIYVTHDWHTMSLRFGWFALPPDESWVKYLGGFAFSFENDHILLLDHRGLNQLEIPHWWDPES
ncbi:MAG: hypothetical protein ACXABO_19240 [Promethearchaeota archaeon]|jgi:phosphohistidine phosphatase SixA